MPIYSIKLNSKFQLWNPNVYLIWMYLSPVIEDDFSRIHRLDELEHLFLLCCLLSMCWAAFWATCIFTSKTCFYKVYWGLKDSSAFLASPLELCQWRLVGNFIKREQWLNASNVSCHFFISLLCMP